MGRRLENLYLGNSAPLSRANLLCKLWPGEGYSDLKYGYLVREEDLDEVIAADSKILRELELSYDRLAEAIEQLFLSDDDEHKGNLVLRREFIESPVCPRQDYCTVTPFSLSKKVTEIVVVNSDKLDEALTVMERYGDLTLESLPELTERDLVMIFSDLHPHLIREQHFLEGYATPYRVDPIRAGRYFGLLGVEL